MAIIRFDFDKAVDGFQSHYNLRTPEPWPEGAYAPLGSDNTKENIQNRGALILWETHKGLCVSEREMNGSSDSDFYMTVWDEEEQRPKEILFATTRGWSYPSMGSYVDASEEILEKVKAYSKKQLEEIERKERVRFVKEKLENRAVAKKLSSQYEFSYARFAKFLKTLEKEKTKSIFKLLQSDLRSGFRISLRTQLVNWLKEKEPAYSKPFSPKQWNYI